MLDFMLWFHSYGTFGRSLNVHLFDVVGLYKFLVLILTNKLKKNSLARLGP